MCDIGDFILAKLRIKNFSFKVKEPPSQEKIQKKFKKSFQPNYQACHEYPLNRETINKRMKILLRSARENETDLRMFIPPFHAKRMENIQGQMCWEPYKQWLSDMVQLVEDDNKTHPGKTPVQLWGFNAYNTFTTETITESKMKWFKDGLHYKKNLANLILDRIFNYHHPNRDLPNDFGLLLTEENLEFSLSE